MRFLYKHVFRLQNSWKNLPHECMKKLTSKHVFFIFKNNHGLEVPRMWFLV